MLTTHIVRLIEFYTWHVSSNIISVDILPGIRLVVKGKLINAFHFQISCLFFIAPPTFIQRLKPYTGALYAAKDVSLQCQVECYPLCEIVWLKNGLPLGESEIYSIKTSTLPPDPTKSDFESVLSTLTWNMTAWPNGVLDRFTDNANYTCQSTSNSVGAGVSSTTYFRVECKSTFN